MIGLESHTGGFHAEYDYDLWGNGSAREELSPSSAMNRARFKGALWMGDVEPDLYYMRARWYEPRTGRFLSEDPIGLAGGINPYVYAANDAVNRWDPLGLCWWIDKPESAGCDAVEVTASAPCWADPACRTLALIDASGPKSSLGNDWVNATEDGPGAPSGGRRGSFAESICRALTRGNDCDQAIAERRERQRRQMCRIGRVAQFGGRAAFDVGLLVGYSSGGQLLAQGVVLLARGSWLAAEAYVGLGATSAAAIFQAVPAKPVLSPIPGWNSVGYYRGGGLEGC